MKENIIILLVTCLLMQGCHSSIDVYSEFLHVGQMAQEKTDWQARMFSSYDRTGGNDDGFAGTYSQLRVENGNSILAEATGSGYISRIWFTHSEHHRDGLLNLENEHIRIFIDNDTVPAIDIPLEDIFNGTEPGFPTGLVGQGLGGWYCNVPIPYSNYCRVEVEGTGVRFYQINLQEYTGDKKVVSFRSLNIDKANQQLKAVGQLLLTGLADGDNLQHQTLSIKAESKGFVELSREQGQISRLFLESAPEKLSALLKSRIRIFWDGQKEPAVDVPVNMFFAIADRHCLHQSLLAGFRNDRLYNYLPMPFSRGARIEIEAADEAFDVKIGYQIEKYTADEVLYLSAFYNEALPANDVDRPFLLLDTKGAGHYVGTFLMTEAKTHGDEQLPVWLEGDEVFTCDGEMRIHGTGTEDYFNCGWYSVPGRLNNPGSFPLHGFPQFSMSEIGKASAYRWHLSDPVPFKESIHVSVEHGTNNTIVGDYRSVAFYYLKNQ